MEKHWVRFPWDNHTKDQVRKRIMAGSGFVIRRIHCHPSDPRFYVMEIDSPCKYEQFDLDVNSSGSWLVRIRKPAGLKRGMSVESFEENVGETIGRPKGMMFDPKTRTSGTLSSFREDRNFDQAFSERLVEMIAGEDGVWRLPVTKFGKEARHGGTKSPSL